MATAVVPVRDLRAQIERYVPRMVEVVGAKDADQYARRQVGLAMIAAQRNPDLAKCDPQSVAVAMIRVCGWKLEIGQTAHLVPFGRECTAIPDWKGLVELMLRSGHVRDVYAEAVYERDHFRMTRGTEPRLEHEPALTKDRGELVGFYAVAVLRHGRTTFEYMSDADVESIRVKARSGNSPAWRERRPEMGKKTVIRRLAKRMPQTDALRSALGVETDTGDVSFEGLAVPATMPDASGDTLAFPAGPRAIASTGTDGYESPELVTEPTRPARSTSYRAPAPGRVVDALEQTRTLENARRAAAQPDPYGHDDLSDEEALALDAQRAAADEMARERGA